MPNKLYFDADHLPPIQSIPFSDKNPHYRLDPISNEVIHDGDDDLQQMIQVAEKSCRIDEILRRYRQSGDPALLQQREAMFGDYRIAEGSYQQMIVLSNQIRAFYDALDPDTKSKVGSLDQFMLAMASEYKTSDVPVVEKIEKKEDSNHE